MGATSSGLVDCVVDGDIQGLRSLLRGHEDAHKAARDAQDAQWALELEEAVHTVVATQIESGQQLQQLQIALELLLQTRPEAWSSTSASDGGGSEPDDEAVTSTSNAACWSACHRACATGNLAFVAFVLQRFSTQFALQARDNFGLFPVDLVPPELLLSEEELAADIQHGQHQVHADVKPPTARTRRSLALQHLRERKAVLQAQHIQQLVPEARGVNSERGDNQVEDDTKSFDAFYVAFEARPENLARGRRGVMGQVHERDAPLRVNYRIPRAERFLSGYFQLIWRELGDARGDEPHYNDHVTRLRDVREGFQEQEAPLEPLQLQSCDSTRPYETKEDSSRRLEDVQTEDEAVQGCFPVDVAHLPEDSVCHVLFVACDRHLLHRTVALSTEGMAVQTSTLDDADSDDYFSDTSDEQVEEEEQEEEPPSHRFFVAGEEFSHPSAVFAGRSFEDVEALKLFVSKLQGKHSRAPQQEQKEKQQAAQDEAQDELRPAEQPSDQSPSQHQQEDSEVSNQDAVKT